MFSSYDNLSSELSQSIHSAVMDYNMSGVSISQQMAITERNCWKVAECIMDVFEESCVMGQLNTFPVYRDWFPYDFDWVEAIEEGFDRGNQWWIVEEHPGIVEDFILPAMVRDGFIADNELEDLYL